MTDSINVTNINSRNPLALIGSTCDVAGNVVAKSGEAIDILMDVLLDVAKGAKCISEGELKKLEVSYDPELMKLIEKHQTELLLKPLSD